MAGRITKLDIVLIDTSLIHSNHKAESSGLQQNTEALTAGVSIEDQNKVWIMDSGAVNHITHDSGKFHTATRS